MELFVFSLFVKWLVVIVGVLNCLFAVAMMCMSSRCIFFHFLLFVCAIPYYLLAVLVGADDIRSLSC